MVEVPEMIEVVGDQMIEVPSYLYEGCPPPEGDRPSNLYESCPSPGDDQMVVVPSYLYEDCLSPDDYLRSNRFDDNLSIQEFHVKDFFRV